MIYLGGTSYYIDGVTVLPDHANKQQFYFLPIYPRLSLDPGTQNLSLSLLEFRGGDSNLTGGFLNFDVNLGIDQKVLDGVAAQIKAAAELDDDPVLSPLPVIDGWVRLVLLGAQTVDPTAGKPGAAGSGGAAGATAAAGAGSSNAGAGGQPVVVGGAASSQFVEHILQAAKPSLFGDEQAIFSVQVDQDGATILDQTLRSTQLTPIGVVYQLDYVALRPAFQVKCNVDWDRVQHHFDDLFAVDAVFVNTQVEKAIDELKESRAIQIEADLFVPEGEDDSTVVSDFQRAEAEVREMVTDAFFKPTLDPVKESKDDWDKAAGLNNTLVRTAVTGGISSLFSVTRKQVDYTRIDKKSLNMNLSERTAVRRSIYPQGHLSGISSAIRANADQYIQQIDLDNPFFQRRKLTAIARTSFADDQLASIHVEAKYGDTPHDVILDGGTPSQSMEWASVLQNGLFQWPVSYNYEVTFQSVDTSQRPMQLSTRDVPALTDRVTVDGNLEVVPRQDLYTLVDVPIYAIQFPWDRWPRVEVETFYSDDVHNLKQQGHIILTSAVDKQTEPPRWKLFALLPADPKQPPNTTFQYRVTYFGADNQVIAMPLTDTSDEQIRVMDPFPNKRTLTIVPVFDWKKASVAFCDVTYDDPQDAFSDTKSFTFDSKHGDPQTYTVDLRNRDLRQVGYQVTIEYADGHEVAVPPSYTLLPRIILRDNMKGHRVITVQTDQGSFTAVNLTHVDVDCKYDDAVGGISAEDTFSLKSPGDVAHFEFDYVDTVKSKYQYQATYYYDGGMTKSTDWIESDQPAVTVPVN